MTRRVCSMRRTNTAIFTRRDILFIALSTVSAQRSGTAIILTLKVFGPDVTFHTGNEQTEPDMLSEICVSFIKER